VIYLLSDHHLYLSTGITILDDVAGNILPQSRLYQFIFPSDMSNSIMNFPIQEKYYQ